MLRLPDGSELALREGLNKGVAGARATSPAASQARPGAQPAAAEGARLPATGPGAALPAVGALLLGLVTLRRRIR